MSEIVSGSHSIKPIFFFVHNRNHVRLLAPVAAQLRLCSRSVAFVDLASWHKDEGAAAELQLRGDKARPIDELARQIPPSATFVFANDWTPLKLVEFIDRVDRTSITMIGVVDGCRFALPHRYTRMDSVLTWGPSSLVCFGERAIVVGSPVVQAAASRSTSFDDPPIVAVNYKFTYDSFDQSDVWLGAVVRACDELGVRYVLSAHPSNRSAPSRALEIEHIDSLLDRASVLISRPSTTIYEAMARGKPVVLFPVRGEKLVEFEHPMRAFETASQAEMLPGLIRRAIEARHGYRNQCRAFLDFHVRPDGQALALTVAAIKGLSSVSLVRE